MTPIQDAMSNTKSNTIARVNLYVVLARLVGQYHRCVENNNVEWEQKTKARIKDLVAAHLPSGSGWDLGTKLDLESSTENKLVFYGAFHHMNDGYYDGWTDHVITVKPSLAFGFSLYVSGRDRNDIKEYAAEMFHDSLEEEVPLYDEP